MSLLLSGPSYHQFLFHFPPEIYPLPLQVVALSPGLNHFSFLKWVSSTRLLESTLLLDPLQIYILDSPEMGFFYSTPSIIYSTPLEPLSTRLPWNVYPTFWYV